jgi:hypothetical protein
MAGELRPVRESRQFRSISNRYMVRIEIAVTYSKQTRGTNSNRHKFRGLPASFLEGLPAEAFRVCAGGVRV